MKNLRKKNTQSGYIALMSAIILSLILTTLAAGTSENGYFARINSANSEYKKISKGLAESCIHTTLLKIAQNYDYTMASDPDYDTTKNTVRTTVGADECFTSSVHTSPSGMTGLKLVTIKTWANYNGAFSTSEVTASIADPTFSPNTKATLFIIVHTRNNEGGVKQSGDFTIHISGTNPYPATFSGSETGTSVYVDPGSFSITETGPSEYSQTLSGCSGNAVSGNTYICTITNDDSPTTATLTVIANVTNDNSGTKVPSDFTLNLDGKVISSGVPVTGITPGSHTLTATTISGYSTSSWTHDCAGNGTVNLFAGSKKTCTITFDDPSPLPLTCADTVMILDRTDNLSLTDLANEKNAATTLVGLYSAIIPVPKIGVGSFGGIDGTFASIPTLGQLSTAYPNVNSVINQITASNSNVGSNVYEGLLAAGNELHSARHTPSKEKVLIYVSNGKPDKPSGVIKEITGPLPPSLNEPNATGDAWNNPSYVYTDGGGNAWENNGHKHIYSTFGFGTPVGTGLPAGATVTGIEFDVDAWSSQTQTTSSVTVSPNDVGSYDEWTAVPDIGASSSISAVNSDDGDDSYINEGTAGETQTYSFAKGSVPAGATINSVTISIVAKNVSAGSTIKIRAEKNTSTWNDGPVITPTGTYETYTRQMEINPFTDSPWTLAEVNNWTTKFGVTKNNPGGNTRITHISISVDYTYTPSETTCKLGIDLSWDGGTSWSTEKTKTLGATESTITFGNSTDTWSNSHTWMPTDFSDANFRVRVHDIDSDGAGALCQNAARSHIDYLQGQIHYSVPIDASTKALEAADILKRDGVKIFTVHLGDVGGRTLLAQLSSGNVPNPGHENGSAYDLISTANSDTGYRKPTDTTALGQFTNPNYIFSSDSQYTTDTTNGHQQGYAKFGINVPASASVTGIETSIRAKSSDPSGCQVGVELSYDNGIHWTSSGIKVNSLSDSDTTYILGGNGNNWGRTWNPSDFASNKFLLRLQNIDPGSVCTDNSILSIDSVDTKVYYSIVAENNDGDGFYLSPTSASLQNIFAQIGAEVCPAIAAPPPPAPPVYGNIVVINHVINDNGGILQSPSFTIHISGGNPSSVTFVGSEAPGTQIKVDPAVNPNYSVSINPIPEYTSLIGAFCSGTISAGQTVTCTITNDDNQPPAETIVSPSMPTNIYINSWSENP